MPGITAPPSTAYRIVDVAENYKRRHRSARLAGQRSWVRRWRRARGCRSATRPRSAISRSIARHNVYSNILWIKQAGVVGTHNHRGTVVMVCLEGSARYLEYDWVAAPGDFIYETPGLIHTLVSDHPEGVKLFGWLRGRDRVLRRERQLRRDARRVVVHQPLRERTAASTASRSTSSSIYSVGAGASSAGSPIIGLADRPHGRRQGRQPRRAAARRHRGAAGIRGAHGGLRATSSRRWSATAPVRARVEALAPGRSRSDGVCAPRARAHASRRRSCRPTLLEEIARPANSALRRSAESPVAVRSSATTEDASDASFAGLQDTYLWVRLRNRCCSACAAAGRASIRWSRSAIAASAAFPKTASRWRWSCRGWWMRATAGVMFTRSPITGDRSVITIEGAWGLGSAVVGGEVTPDRWVVGKITGEITVRDISDKHHSSTVPAAGRQASRRRRARAELRQARLPERRGACSAARRSRRRVERHYGCAQDIEWAVERDSGEILLLQSRPETVWSAKETSADGTRGRRIRWRTSCRSSEADGESDGEGRRGDHAAAGAVELRRARSRDRRHQAPSRRAAAPARPMRTAVRARGCA